MAGVLAALVMSLALSDGHWSLIGLHGHDEPPAAAEVVDRGLFAAPPDSVRPAIRWWWPGGDVNDQELKRELGLMHAAGFGSAEIQSFAVGLPPGASSAVHTYGTPQWFDRVGAALDHAQSLGMTLDLTLGSSWPTASPDLKETQSLKQLTVTAHYLSGPQAFNAAVPAAIEPMSYPLADALFKFPSTYDASQMSLVAVLGARRSANQTPESAAGAPMLPGLPNLPDTVYLEAGSVITLAPYLTSKGKLEWSVPPGNWVVFALYQGPTGSRPFYDATGGTAVVVDHFNESAVRAGFESLAQRAADRLGSRFGTSLRSLFVDSAELRTELYWSDDLLNEFAARRGYRVEAFLPVLFRPLAADAYLHKVYPNAPPSYEIRGVGPRVRQDYEQTVAELMVERFYKPVREWSEARGVSARVQAHGAPVDLLNAYGQASIPETEGLYAGGRPAFLKFAVSAARTAGRPIVSSEILAFKNAPGSPTAMFQEANKNLAAGVNQLVFHGFPYVYDAGFQFPGWMPFQSPYLPGANIIGTFGSALNDRNPIWPYVRKATDYVSRAQLVLRTGSPRVDVAVYSGALGYPDDPTLDPPVPAALAAAGYDFDYLNGDLLRSASVSDNALQVGANRYGALIVPDGSPMPVAIATRIASLAASGVPVVIVGDIPHASVGLQDLINNQDTAVQSGFETLLGTARDALPADGTVRSGSAIFVSSASRLEAALDGDFKVAPGIRIGDRTHPIAYTHRRTPSADYYFLSSASHAAFDVPVTFPNPKGRVPEIWDLRGGKVFAAPFYSNTTAGTEVLLHFEPGTALVVGFDSTGTPSHLEPGSSLPGVYRNDSGDLEALVDAPGSYMAVLNGGVSQIVTVPGPALSSIGLPTWDIVVGTRDAAGNGTQAFQRSALLDLASVAGYSGNAIYTAYLDFTNLDAAYRSRNVRLLLDLGRVADVADVRVNDKELAGTKLTAPYTVDVSDYLVAGLNKFQVTLATLPGQKPAGVLGPVTLVPRYRAVVPKIRPLQTSMVVTPANFPNNTPEDMIFAIRRAAAMVNHVNFQWFWKTPPNEANPDGGAVVECAQVSTWVEEARRLNLGVTLQFQSFYSQVRGSYEGALDTMTQGGLPVVVRISSPIAPFATATFADPALSSAYLDQINCLAGLKPEYLVLGPEVNFINVFNHAEWLNFLPVYSQAYEIAKTMSPTTQVGMSFQYDGLRRDRLLSGDDWSILTTGPRRDFVALTTYYGFSADRNDEFPTPSRIPDDYYAPIRQVLGPDVPVIFTEVGWSSFFANGLQTQADFIKRMPTLLGVARPDNITWALQHDVQYFEGPGSSLNQSGLLLSNGDPKPSWNQALAFMREGVFTGVSANVFQPSPLPFSVTAVPPNFPVEKFTQETGFQAIATAAEVSKHVSLQFAWKDHVTGQVWNCEDVRPYVEEADRQGLRTTLQFNTFAALPSANPSDLPTVILLNPIDPPDDDGDLGPSFANSAIRDAYLEQVSCLASLKPDYLVLGPELNFLVASRYEEFERFSSVYRAAYQRAKAASPSTQVGTSWQYDAIRFNLLHGIREAYIEQLGPQDYIGLTSYFAFSVQNVNEYPWPLQVPIDYYQPVRARFGNSTPIVFTEIGWSSAFPNGPANQALFLNRLLLLLGDLKPANVIWGLQHDVVNYFPGEIAALNQLGLRLVDGTPKPAWNQVQWLKDRGLYISAPPTVR